MSVNSTKNTKQNKNKNSQNQSICQSLLDFSKCEQWVTTNPGPLSFILNSNLATFNAFQDKSRAGVCIISIHFGRNNYLTYELIQERLITLKKWSGNIYKHLNLEMLSPCEEWCMSHHWRMFRIFPQAILSPSKKAVKNLTTTDSAKCYSHSANRSIKFRSFQTELRDLTPQISLITCLAYTPPWVSPSYFRQHHKIQTLCLYYNLF